jgi:hydrogenase expression/formation protein HypE
MLEATDHIHCLRDPTRGGVATSLNEIAAASGVGLEINEEAIPVRENVKGACEILGLDPLYVANEGKLLALVGSDAAEKVIERMRRHELGRQAEVIGEVVAEHPGKVLLKTEIGGTRVVDLLSGEQLPRIC